MMDEETMDDREPVTESGTLPSDVPVPEPAHRHKRWVWIPLGAVVGLALGTSARLVLPADGDGSPTPSPSLSPSQSPAPETSQSVSDIDSTRLVDLGNLDWRDASPDDVQNEGETPADDSDILASVGPLWAIETLNPPSPNEYLHPTDVDLLAPEGSQYKMADLLAPHGGTLRPVEWDPSAGLALLENRISWDENEFILIDLHLLQWAPLALPADWSATRVGTASGGRSIYLMTDDADVRRLYVWDFAKGWVPLGGPLDIWEYSGTPVLLPYEGDWLVYQDSDALWHARELSNRSARDLTFTEVGPYCGQAAAVDSTTIVFRWCEHGEVWAFALPTLDPVPVSLTYTLEQALAMSEHYQVPNTALVLSSVGTPNDMCSTTITSIGVVTTDGYRELATLDTDVGGAIGQWCESSGYVPSMIEPAPGLFVFHQGESLAVIADVVTGQVLTYGSGEEADGVLVYVPQGDSTS